MVESLVEARHFQLSYTLFNVANVVGLVGSKEAVDAIVPDFQ